jgi:hypothetical protein
MEIEKKIDTINNFDFENKQQKVSFIETMRVVDGVECDVYTFDSDNTKDLGIIRIAPNKKPLYKK